MATPEQRLGEYILIDRIASGAFGEVWRARHHVWAEQVVAVKIPTEPDYVRNLQKEGEAIRRLAHPNIVKAIAFDPFADPAYLVMEYVPGASLRILIQRGPMQVQHAVAVMKQVLAALHHAHKNGVIHRDIKPENILIHKKVKESGFAPGTVKLTDFGLGRTFVETANSIVLSSEDKQAGEIVGSTQYMAPEQLEGQELDARADLYACGVVLFEMLTGKRPIGTEVPSELNAAVPSHLDEVFRRACSRKDRRLDSAEQFFEALSAQPAAAVDVQAEAPTQVPTQSARRRIRWKTKMVVASTAAAVVLLAVLVLTMTTKSEPNIPVASPVEGPGSVVRSSSDSVVAPRQTPIQAPAAVTGSVQSAPANVARPIGHFQVSPLGVKSGKPLPQAQPSLPHRHGTILITDSDEHFRANWGVMAKVFYNSATKTVEANGTARFGQVILPETWSRVSFEICCVDKGPKDLLVRVNGTPLKFRSLTDSDKGRFVPAVVAFDGIKRIVSLSLDNETADQASIFKENFDNGLALVFDGWFGGWPATVQIRNLSVQSTNDSGNQTVSTVESPTTIPAEKVHTAAVRNFSKVYGFKDEASIKQDWSFYQKGWQPRDNGVSIQVSSPPLGGGEIKSKLGFKGDMDVVIDCQTMADWGFYDFFVCGERVHRMRQYEKSTHLVINVKRKGDKLQINVNGEETAITLLKSQLDVANPVRIRQDGELLLRSISIKADEAVPLDEPQK